jgi:signal transduction histidine kinase
MHSYTAFVYGGLKTPGDNARADGIALARQCLDGLKDAGDVKQFPPQLLVLLVSPAYLDLQDAAQLVDGIREVFEASGHGDIKLVGTSVAAVFFEHEIHDNGALLVCLASRLLDVSTGVGIDADKDPQTAVRSLLDKLGLGDHGKDLNPMSSRMLLTFFPDITWGVDGSNAYRSDELHNLLWNSTLCRIPIAGGVSAGYKRQGGGAKGLQFCGWSVYTDSLVVAQVDSGAPLGVSLCRGLETLSDDKGIVRVRVKSLSESGDYIEELEDLRGRKWNNNGTYLLLSEDTTERDFIIAGTDPQGGSRFRVIDKVSEGDTLQVRQQRPEMLLDMAADIVDQANRRVHVANPLACLSLICSSHFHNGWKMDLDIQQAIKNIEGKYHTCVGGFVDGEAGVDFTGRSQFGNWSMVGIGFGDEMRDRTPLHRGFKALAAYSPQLTEETKLGEAIKESLNLIFETGFPGAMISFPLRDQSREYIVGMGAIGARFSQIVGETRRPLDGKDALANVIKSRVARFISDTRESPDCDPIEKALLVSQYIIPLRGPGDNIIAVLQIDLGKTDNLSSSQQGVLDSLGAAVGSGLNRILNWEVVEVARQLDHVLKASLQAETLNEGLQSFIEAATITFGASMGHVRIANTERRCLVLAAGVGDYFEAAKLCRPEIDFDDGSPTCEAYSTGDITIVNDAHNNPAHQELIERCKRTWLKGPLSKVGSYANTAFRGQGEGSIGTINLVSEKTWFFTWQHQHSLKALGERVGFLVEHLEQKEKKAEATRRLNFLLNASPQLNRIQNFDDIPSALYEATERFRVAANAHVASLYLWDAQIGQFVMRAEAGWRERAWVNAARYREGEGWIGRLESEPVHVDELGAEEEYYARQMFGPEPAEGEAISAIGLPLIVDGKSLGTLALYRRERHANAEGFTKTGFPELRESADSIAALLSILRSRQETIFSRRMQEDFKKVSRIFQQDEKSLSVLEKTLCKLITEIFGAACADFYFYDTDSSPAKVSTYSRRGFGRGRARPEADELIAETRGGGAHKFVLRENPDGDRANPALAATEGRVTRLCIPVFVEQKVAGVLDIRWNDEQPRQGWEVVQHSDAQLRILGTVIGSAHNRYRLAAGQEVERRSKERERQSKEEKQRGFQAMNLLQSQSEHYLRNLLIALGTVPRSIRAASSDAAREVLASELAKHLQTGHAFINQLLKVALMCASLDPKHCDLKPLIQEVVAGSRKAKGVPGGEDIVEGADALRVYIDYECVKQAFTNILDNALDAIRRRGGEGTLKIAADEDERGAQVTIIFENEGGMTPEIIEAALKGQLERRGRICSGVNIASHLINVQGGTFNIESDGVAWTRVRVTLPLSQTEEDN